MCQRDGQPEEAATPRLVDRAGANRQEDEPSAGETGGERPAEHIERQLGRAYVLVVEHSGAGDDEGLRAPQCAPREEEAHGLADQDAEPSRACERKGGDASLLGDPRGIRRHAGDLRQREPRVERGHAGVEGGVVPEIPAPEDAEERDAKPTLPPHRPVPSFACPRLVTK